MTSLLTFRVLHGQFEPGGSGMGTDCDVSARSNYPKAP